LSKHTTWNVLTIRAAAEANIVHPKAFVFHQAQHPVKAKDILLNILEHFGYFCGAQEDFYTAIAASKNLKK
jgi:hypothetical protein